MPKKILLADDSLTIQKVVELTFSDSDFDLTCVSNGSRALEKVQEDRPDLILADVVMPEKNGYEVCEAIKGDPSTAGIPVILLTGTFEPFDRARAERMGADAIVSKPFDSQQLLDQVEALLARAPETPPLGVSRGARETPDLRRPSREDVEPFEAGFSAEDFTGSLRVPFGQEQADPFEEEYGRGDVDSAIRAFERTADSPFETEAAPRPARSIFVPEVSEPESFRDTGWLEEEGERTGGAGERAPFGSSAPPTAHWTGEDTDGSADLHDDAAVGSGDREVSRRGSRRVPSRLESEGDDFAPPADDTPTLEVPSGAGVGLRASEDALALEEISAAEAEILFDVPETGETRERQRPGTTESGDAGEPSSPEPRELEALAQTSSIPELAQMLSSVSRPAGELSDAEIDRVASRVVEKLSDRILREIAWEVIPDMAEIVIKKRIKELESGIE